MPATNTWFWESVPTTRAFTKNCDVKPLLQVAGQNPPLEEVEALVLDELVPHEPEVVVLDELVPPELEVVVLDELEALVLATDVKPELPPDVEIDIDVAEVLAVVTAPPDADVPGAPPAPDESQTHGAHACPSS
jgi:hypothetical protein